MCVRESVLVGWLVGDSGWICGYMCLGDEEGALGFWGETKTGGLMSRLPVFPSHSHPIVVLLLVLILTILHGGHH